MCLPQVRLGEAVADPTPEPASGPAVTLDADALLVHPLLTSAPVLSLWRAPTDNDELGGMAARWHDWGLDELVRKVVDVREEGSRVVVVAEYATGAGPVRHEQVFTPVAGGLRVEESAELPEGLDDVARVGTRLRDGRRARCPGLVRAGPLGVLPGPERGRARRAPLAAGGRAVHPLSAARRRAAAGTVCGGSRCRRRTPRG